MEFEFKEIEKKDEKQLMSLIKTVLDSLENKEYFIPYEKWELESMFDKTYAPLYGAYDKEKNLVLPEYRGKGLITELMKMQSDLAKKMGFDYIISMAHPDNIGSKKSLEKVGLKYVKTTTVNEKFLRDIYMKKL